MMTCIGKFYMWLFGIHAPCMCRGAEGVAEGRHFVLHTAQTVQCILSQWDRNAFLVLHAALWRFCSGLVVDGKVTTSSKHEDGHQDAEGAKHCTKRDANNRSY
jgi:hypothetical protein